MELTYLYRGKNQTFQDRTLDISKPNIFKLSYSDYLRLYLRLNFRVGQTETGV